jgi:dephospho-CoA kinase
LSIADCRLPIEVMSSQCLSAGKAIVNRRSSIDNSRAAMRSSPNLSAFGLTGGIACGKTTVAGYFREVGAHILDADALGHELLGSGQPAYQDIIERFGEKVLDANNEIDRRKLGAVVFSNALDRQALNAILHPRIIARLEELVREQQSRDAQSVVIVDAPLIYEAGIAGEFRKVIAVWCRPEQQLDLHYGVGLSAATVDHFIGVGYSFRYQLLRR